MGRNTMSLACAAALFLLATLHTTTCLNTIKIGAVLTQSNYSNAEKRVIEAALQELQKGFAGYNFTVVYFELSSHNHDVYVVQDIACKMIDEKILGFVSAVANARQARIVNDVASALNLLHVSSITHLVNLYQSLHQDLNVLTPSVHTDYNIRLNDLFYNYMQDDYFKWRRVVILYDPSVDISVLGNLIEHGRSSKWIVMTKMLPPLENITEWKQNVQQQVLNSAARRAERYFLFFMGNRKAVQLLDEALLSNLTTKSFYFLMMSPLNFAEESLYREVLERYPRNQINLLLTHRMKDENFVKNNLRLSTMFLGEFLANYSIATGVSNAWNWWPIRYDRIIPKSQICDKVKDNASVSAKPIPFSEILDKYSYKSDLSEQNANTSSDGNRFQKAFESSKYGKDFGKLVISQMIVGQNKTSHNIVFPCEQCQKSLQNSVFRVVAFEDEPYVIINKNSPRLFEGFCVDILDAIAQRLQINFVWSQAAESVVGRHSNTYGWNGIIKVLMDRNADVSGNLIEVNPLRAEAIKFSEPVFAGGNMGVAKMNVTRVPDFYTFMEPFDNSLWLAILGAMIGSSLCFWFIAQVLIYKRKHYPLDSIVEGNGHPLMMMNDRKSTSTAEAEQAAAESEACSDIVTYGDSLWYTVAAILCKDCNVEPRNLAGKVLSAFLVFFTVIIIGYYTANLAAFLALEQKSVDINNVDDLADSMIDKRILDSSGTSQFLKESDKIPTYRKLYEYLINVKGPKKGFVDSKKEGVKGAKSGKYAFVGDSRAIRYWLRKKDCVEDMVIIGEEFGKMGFSFGFPRGSPLSEKFSLVLLDMVEKGVIRDIEKKWFDGEAECDLEKVLVKTLALGSSAEALGIANIYGVIFILLAGFLIAAIFVSVQYLGMRRAEKNLIKMLAER